MNREIKNIPFTAVQITDSFWKPRLDINRDVIIPFEYEQCKKTGRLAAWKLEYKDGKGLKPHIYWDSDVAKWIEASAYSLAKKADEDLEKKIDEIIDLMEKAQLPDGYLNSYYIAVEPEKRWSNLRDKHELYCAGHLMEAAVAYYNVTGKKKFLEIMCRYTDCIDRTFGPEKGKLKGYCGHEEIELALIKLYKVTREKRYLKLAEFFVDERGKQPYYFDLEAEKRGETPDTYPERYSYYQAAKPVREQTSAEGHAVRACYLFAGMADVARETNDEKLLDACRKIWDNITQKRMYITGGIGSGRPGERFTFDYDLPNDSAYAETCAAIALVFFAQRMLHAEGDSKYADVIEKTLYNGILSGVGLDGKSFYYENLLEFNLAKTAFFKYNRTAGIPDRQPWFDCACCPPNIARLLASLGDYIYSISKDFIRVNLYIGSHLKMDKENTLAEIDQITDYPWSGKVRINVTPKIETPFTVSLRYPGWCKKATVKINGRKIDHKKLISRGFIDIDRRWTKGDKIEIDFAMPVEFIGAHPEVRNNIGKTAVQRGPLVYCFEEVDNGRNLSSIILPAKACGEVIMDKALGGFAGIKIPAQRLINEAADLYHTQKGSVVPFTAYAVPYSYMENRKTGEMAVWLMRKF